MSAKINGYVGAQTLESARNGFWWATIAPLILFMNDSIFVVAAAKSAFNIALLVASPFAARVLKKGILSPKTILVLSTLLRSVLYATFPLIYWSGLEQKWLSAICIAHCIIST